MKFWTVQFYVLQPYIWTIYLNYVHELYTLYINYVNKLSTHKPCTHEPRTHEPCTHEPCTHEPCTREPCTHEPFYTWTMYTRNMYMNYVHELCTWTVLDLVISRLAACRKGSITCILHQPCKLNMYNIHVQYT